MAWTLYNRNCLDVMSELGDRSVDHWIGDPPYDEKTHRGALVAGQIDFDPLFSFAHVRQALRIARRWVIMFCALEQLGDYKAAAGNCWIRSGIWVRHSGPQKSGDRPAQGAEGIAIMHAGRGKKEWNGGGKAGVWTCPLEATRVHPTQKPEALMDALIVDFTNYGDTVFDGYSGSGTTGVAAIRRGRNFVGCELDSSYYSEAYARLSATREQSQMFVKKKRAKQIDFLKPVSDVRPQEANHGEDGEEDEASEVPAADGQRQGPARGDVPAGV